MGYPAMSQDQQAAQWRTGREDPRCPTSRPSVPGKAAPCLTATVVASAPSTPSYLDDRTGVPEWALVNTGLFGTNSNFVPLAQAFQSDNDVVVLYDKQLVRNALQADPEQHLSEAEERQLWRHYGLDYDTNRPHCQRAAGRHRPGQGGTGHHWTDDR
jgi:hypothetical protein